jgi:DNA-binding LacI/PurR family transcriptional regulator
LDQLNFNYVILNYYWGRAKANYVGIDYEKDTYNAVKYLIDLGHRKVALIVGTREATVNMRIIKSYKKALEDNDINADDDAVAFGDYDYQLAYEQTQKIIKYIPSVTSFLVGGFEMAPACLKAVKDSGLKVPQDISIICFIDNEIMPLLDPSITAIKWPYYEMGKKAAMMLLEKDADKKKYIFETELVIRGSTDTRH